MVKDDRAETPFAFRSIRVLLEEHPGITRVYRVDQGATAWFVAALSPGAAKAAVRKELVRENPLTDAVCMTIPELHRRLKAEAGKDES